MSRSFTLAVAITAACLSGCASRPPDPTAGTPAPTSAPPVAASGAAQRSSATAAGPSGNVTASSVPAERSVYFEFDSSALSPRAQTIVQQNARAAAPRNAHVRLEGNADERGSREYNLALGQRRAEAVRQAMVLDGVRADTVEALSNGEERPRCTEHTEDCYATNRRVDILVAP